MTDPSDQLARTVRRQRLELRLLALLVLFVALLPSGLPAAGLTLLLMAAGKLLVDNLTAEPPDDPDTPPETR